MRVRKPFLLALAALLMPGVIGIVRGGARFENVEEGAAAAQTAPSAPAFVRRGDEVEAHYRAYRERLERLYETLSVEVNVDAPDLYPKLEASRPKPVVHGYQLLPKVVPDEPAPRKRPLARSAWYSWPWTERLIELQVRDIRELEAELERIPTLTPVERRAACDKLVADYLQLPESQRTIDAHIHYNRLWQPAIAADRPAYSRQTALHDAVLERQALLLALSATDDVAFHKALSAIRQIDSTKARDALDADLRQREGTLFRAIHQATDQISPPPFLRVEHPTPRRWVVHLPFYTDIEESGFVQAFKTAVESVWQLRDGEEEFGVQLSMTYVPAARLYRGRPECSREDHVTCMPPRRGDQIDLNAHVALFPADGGVLTTGALSTHVTGRAIALGPHDITPHVLAHEFGHMLGFRDMYFRGYKDLGADGFQVMEVSADPRDIMGAPGTGLVQRRHFEKVIGVVAKAVFP